MTGRVFRHRPPAGADFQQVVGLAKRQLVAQARHFGLLSRREILLVCGKERAGVKQFPVQKMDIEGVAQVVMGGNIFTRLRAGVTPRPVAQTLQRSAKQPEPFLKTAKHLAVEGQDLQKRRELRGFPFAVHPGFSGGKAPAR